MKKLLALIIISSFASITSAAGGTDLGNPWPWSGDPCEEALKINYIDYVVKMGIRNCDKYLADFPTGGHGGTISPLWELKNPNLYYSVLVRDSKSSASISAVVKCDVNLLQVSLVTLEFASIHSYGSCSASNSTLGK